VAIFAKAALHRSSTHQVNRCSGDYLNGWHFCDVAKLLAYLVGVEIGQGVYSFKGFLLG
jgi:hypothetical protein